MTDDRYEELAAIKEITDILGRDTPIHVSHRHEEPYKSLVRDGVVTWRRPTPKEIFSPARFRMVGLTDKGYRELSSPTAHL